MDSEVEKSEADSADHSSEMPDQELEDITEKEISIEPKAQEEQKTMSTNSQSDETEKVDKAFQDNGNDYKRTIERHLKKERETLIRLAVSKGVKVEHVTKFLSEEKIPDFELDNLLIRMGSVLTPDNGYEPDQFKNQKQKRRTEAELDQMIN